MKFTIYILTIMLFIQCSSNGQTNNNIQTENTTLNQMENYELSPENAHSNAKVLLKDDFYWSEIDESSPFGNDDGSDSFAGFRQWRVNNQTTNPILYIKDILSSWNFPMFNIYETDSTIIKNYINEKSQIEDSETIEQISVMREHFKKMAKESGQEFSEEQFKQIIAQVSGNMGGSYLYAIDNAIIAVGFGQYVLEGNIDSELKELTLIALERELLPITIEKWGEFKTERIEKLNKMILAVNGMN